MVPPRLTLVSNNTRERDAISGSDEDRAAHDGTGEPALSDPEAVVDHLCQSARREKLRRLEALLFASSAPLDAKSLAAHLDPEDDVHALLIELQSEYKDRGVTLVRVAGRWQFRTADDLSYLLERQQKDQRRLSKAALETLAIIAYHQPVTRAEIEEIRGVTTSPGTLDVLMETGWIRPRGRRRAPGRPLTYGTTDEFLVHFGLETIKDLPGLSDLKSAGLLDSNLPPNFTVPSPNDVAALMPDELPLTDDGDSEDEEAVQESLALSDEGEEVAEAEDGPESEG
jgi:segregation and condensation protein B